MRLSRSIIFHLSIQFILFSVTSAERAVSNTTVQQNGNSSTGDASLFASNAMGSITITSAPTRSSNPNEVQNTIPGLLTESCMGGEFGDGPPCVASCKESDSACRNAASSIVSTCKPQWDTWTSIQRQLLPTPTTGAWSWFTSVDHYSYSGSVHTTTLSVYTSFSTVTDYTYVNVYGSTITPVYALGKPTITESVVPNGAFTATILTGPTPQCRYNYVSWAVNDGALQLQHLNSQTFTVTCGQCSLYGGDVQLYWWPSPTTASSDDNLRTPESPTSTRTTVVDGMTLVSPTVYVSLHNLSASNSCSVVGRTIKQTLIAMDPTDVSTLVHIGGKVAQTAANQYGTLNFNQLTGLPSASVYEQQPDCIDVGCPTIYPGTMNFTIVVPSKVRSMDPAWSDCAAGLQGLYDPPIALAARRTVDGATASPDAPKETWTAIAPTTTVKAAPAKSLAGILKTNFASSMSAESSTQGPQQKSRGPVVGSSAGDPIGPHTRPELHSPDPGASSEIPKASPGSDIRKGSGRPTNVPTGAETAHHHDRPHTRTHLANPSNNVEKLEITTDSRGQYVVDGQTFAPGTPIVLKGKDGSVTYRMLTTGTRTYIAIGTSTTVPLGEPPEQGGRSTGGLSALEFTRASDGNFVLSGTTLVSGRLITIGTGTSRTTLRMTTVDHTPAVVVDGTLTERLGHDKASQASHPSTGPPEITSALATIQGPDTNPHSERPTSTSSGSTTAQCMPTRSQIVLIFLFVAAKLLTG